MVSPIVVVTVYRWPAGTGMRLVSPSASAGSGVPATFARPFRKSVRRLAPR